MLWQRPAGDVEVERNGASTGIIAGRYRKDVLLFTERLDKNEMKKIINSLELKDEILHFGQLGVYWVKFDKSTYSQTAYHKKLLKTPFYPDITIRNARTFSKIGHFLRMK